MSDRRISSKGYHHTVEAWTVGRLRAALEGVPDDTIVAASIPLSLAPRPADPAGGEDYDWVMTDVEEAPSTGPEPISWYSIGQLDGTSTSTGWWRMRNWRTEQQLDTEVFCAAACRAAIAQKTSVPTSQPYRQSSVRPNTRPGAAGAGARREPADGQAGRGGPETASRRRRRATDTANRRVRAASSTHTRPRPRSAGLGAWRARGCSTTSTSARSTRAAGLYTTRRRRARQQVPAGPPFTGVRHSPPNTTAPRERLAGRARPTAAGTTPRGPGAGCGGNSNGLDGDLAETRDDGEPQARPRPPPGGRARRRARNGRVRQTGSSTAGERGGAGERGTSATRGLGSAGPSPSPGPSPCSAKFGDVHRTPLRPHHAGPAAGGE
ncbi:hypothetical protein C9F11_42800 (plasmid) [Streptomyces sp. YIM 121038]|nr:hypothetical protein C9F11_42800 [Streptomyces sp. YIM 121038]